VVTHPMEGPALLEVLEDLELVGLCGSHAGCCTSGTDSIVHPFDDMEMSLGDAAKNALWGTWFSPQRVLKRSRSPAKAAAWMLFGVRSLILRMMGEWSWRRVK
jgi:hypothetical protein